MKGLGNWLSQTRIIWMLGGAFLALMIGFGIVIQIHDLHIIDEISDPVEVEAVLNAMSPAQTQAHFWMTLILDMPYPLVYGGFYIGLALRFFGRFGPWLAIPAIICIPADLIENTIQLLVLSGDRTLLWGKAIITPIKLITFVAGSLVALVAIGVAIGQRLR